MPPSLDLCLASDLFLLSKWLAAKILKYYFNFCHYCPSQLISSSPSATWNVTCVFMVYNANFMGPSLFFFSLLCLSFWRMLCTSKRKMKLRKEEKDFNGSLNSMSALVLSISTSCRVPLNCPVIAVRGTQSIAWWKHMNHSNKPFHILCLKTPQELIKIRTNNFISIYYFLFFSLFQILPC